MTDMTQPVDIEALPQLIERLCLPLRVDAFDHVEAGEPNFNAMLLADEDPGCARILAQEMLDQTANDIADAINALPSLLTELEALRAERGRMENGLKVAEDAMREMFRYYDGGETRGSYDGKPERNGLRKAWHEVRSILASLKEPSQ